MPPTFICHYYCVRGLWYVDPLPDYPRSAGGHFRVGTERIPMTEVGTKRSQRGEYPNAHDTQREGKYLFHLNPIALLIALADF